MPKPFELLAVMTSDTSGDQYEIRKDTAGVTYCWSRSKNNLCNAWKFNRDSPKSCKHIRQFHAHELTLPTTPTHVLPMPDPMLAVAGPMVDRMLAAASSASHATGRTSLTSRVTNAEHAAMITSLAKALAAYVPKPHVAATSTVQPASGVRYITFED